MIGYLYNLSLDEVNRVISEINLELSNKGVVTKDKPAPESKLLANIEIGGPSTEMSVDRESAIGSMSILNDEMWGFTSHVFTNQTCDISIYFNKDETATNYERVDVYNSHGASASGSTATDSKIMVCTGVDWATTLGTIIFVKDRNFAHIHFSSYREGTDTFQTGVIHYTLPSGETDLYKVKLKSSVANSIIKDSHFKLWKIF